jgi:hypothetical protein
VSHVTSWNERGIRWRELSAGEILWMVHSETIRHLAAESPAQVRRYLNQTRDWEMLREWDNKRMSDRASDGGAGDAHLRGR